MSYADITLVSGATTITLPAAMEWVDRRARNLVAQNVEFAANGAQIIEEFQQQGGFPITLVAKGKDDTWVRRPQIDALLALADSPLIAPMTLTYNDGTTYLCRFRYDGATPAIDALPVSPLFPQDDTTGYSLTLRLRQASA